MPESGKLTRNAFLGGRVQLWQPQTGYRAGIDPVLLAASIPAVPGESVLELGCGAGAALFCLGARVPDLALYGVELQNSYAELARRNAAENGIHAEVIEADLSSLPRDLRALSFDHVFANPPYFLSSDGTSARDHGRALALSGQTPMGDWVQVAAKRIKVKGTATFIQRVERLPELLSQIRASFGSICVLPIAPRHGRAAKLFIVRATKGARADFRLLAPLILHRGTVHLRDEDDYTDEITQVLRNAAPLNF